MNDLKNGYNSRYIITGFGHRRGEVSSPNGLGNPTPTILLGILHFLFILRFYLQKSAKSAPLSEANDTNKTILPIDILPCGNSPLVLHKTSSGANFRVPAMGIL